MRRLTIYTDGGCDPNPGPGGYGIVILEEGKPPLEISGGEPNTTNNRMEMTAALEALRSLPEPTRIELYTDSMYLKDGVTKWMKGWREKGWITKAKEPVKNRDLWEALDKELQRHLVEWRWTKGHAGNEWNELADRLASRGIARPSAISLENGELAIYAGVSFSAKDGSGGIALIMRYRGDAGVAEKTFEKRIDESSANRLHLLTAIEAFGALKRRMKIHFFTSSDYLKDGATRWVSGWRERGWKTREGEDVSHRDLWERVASLTPLHSIVWHVVQKEGEVPPEMALVKQRAHDARVAAQDQTTT